MTIATMAAAQQLITVKQQLQNVGADLERAAEEFPVLTLHWNGRAQRVWESQAHRLRARLQDARTELGYSVEIVDRMLP